jgi:hypothetical protein
MRKILKTFLALCAVVVMAASNVTSAAAATDRQDGAYLHQHLHDEDCDHDYGEFANHFDVAVGNSDRGEFIVDVILTAGLVSVEDLFAGGLSIVAEWADDISMLDLGTYAGSNLARQITCCERMQVMPGGWSIIHYRNAFGICVSEEAFRIIGCINCMSVHNREKVSRTGCFL